MRRATCTANVSSGHHPLSGLSLPLGTTTALNKTVTLLASPQRLGLLVALCLTTTMDGNFVLSRSVWLKSAAWPTARDDHDAVLS
ncbi:hypothetical protein AMS68_000002 [Peltaster fructicola]|uniref:Uncharacterized protein n=1 Tax=Peltaster fructicola TaxID=286661 RepID=A0A6H0XIN3_9PEZI|nr:hypothetical protein AMS68_000002 [Peltaster fructicola]